MYGKELLEKGVLWRVGDGKTIRLIKECWVPDHPMLLKPKVPLPNDLTISFLIDDEKGKWNKDLIHECFDDVVADKILHIPLCHTPCVDLPAWQHNKLGVYTVKSGYYLTRLRLSTLMDLYIHPLYVLVSKILSSILNSPAPIHRLSTLSTVGPNCHFI
jgi:hypothetical protein